MRRNIRKKDKAIQESKNVTAPNKEASSDPKPRKGVIANAAVVNLRSATKGGAVIGKLMYGDSVEILEEVDDVYKVKTRTHKVGFVFSHYVKEV